MICNNGPGSDGNLAGERPIMRGDQQHRRATPVANRPKAMADASLLSQCTMAIAINSHTACK